MYMYKVQQTGERLACRGNLRNARAGTSTRDASASPFPNRPIAFCAMGNSYVGRNPASRGGGEANG